MKWFLRGETKKKILFLGDGITCENSYADILKDYFETLNPSSETEIIKSALGGETISGLSEPSLKAPRPCLFDRLDEAVSCKPDAVVFCYGTNDGIYHPFSNKRFTDFKNAVQKLIDILYSENIKIVAMTPPPFDASAAEPAEDENYSEHAPCESYGEVVEKYSGYITKLEGDKRIEAIIDLNGILKDFAEKKKETDSTYKMSEPEAHDLIARTVLKELFNITLTAPIGDFTDAAYHGFERKNFYFAGREATFILPKKWAEGKPWIWRAEFLGAFDAADRAMLENGWGLAYLNLSDMYGCDEAVDIMHRFQTELVKMFSLREKSVLFGFSRGGLYSVNYSAKYPECIAGIYLDAPVIDIYSWPGGFGEGSSNPKSTVWLECKMLYGADDKKKNSYKETLPAKFDVLLKNNIPVMYVAGGADSVVPYLENGVYLVDTYLKGGGKIKIYIESWRDHHPHSLEEPSEIVRYIIDEMN